MTSTSWPLVHQPGAGFQPSAYPDPSGLLQLQRDLASTPLSRLVSNGIRLRLRAEVAAMERGIAVAPH